MNYKDLTKIDAHVHFNTNRGALLDYGKKNNISYLSINTDIPFFPTLNEQEETAQNLASAYGSQFNYITSFEIAKWGTPNWAKKSIDRIKKSIDNGAIGVKVWKNIGMTLQDDSGCYVGIDDESFDPIFNYLEENNIIVLGHIGEPRNCWLPLEEMTVDQDRAYFKEHPEYHMALLPELPLYEHHLNSRNKRLIKNPTLHYVGLHLASQEWSVDEVSKFLDQFPLANVDLAERICHLQYQAISNWKKVYEFFIKYQDRIIYGSDVIDDNSLTDQQLVELMHERYTRHWQFLTQGDEMTAPKVTGAFNGMQLPPNVVEKIYSLNALRIYSKLKK